MHLCRSCAEYREALRTKYKRMRSGCHRAADSEQLLSERGVTPETTYLYMHGHTLMDNVVMVCLQAVCEKLRELSIARIHASDKKGLALKNELANYNNSLRSIRDVLLDNENYTECPLYQRLKADIEHYLEQAIKKFA